MRGLLIISILSTFIFTQGFSQNLDSIEINNHVDSTFSNTYTKNVDTIFLSDSTSIDSIKTPFESALVIEEKKSTDTNKITLSIDSNSVAINNISPDSISLIKNHKVKESLITIELIDSTKKQITSIPGETQDTSKPYISNISTPNIDVPLMNKLEVKKVEPKVGSKKDFIKTKTTPKPKHEPLDFRDILLAIKVVEIESNTPLRAIVQTISQPHTKGNGVCNVDGKFHFHINNYSNLEMRISKQGYHTFVDTINIQEEGFDGNIYTKVYFLTPFKKGDIVQLDNIYFKQGDDHLLVSSHDALNKVSDMMKLNPTMVIQLGGHTENRGSKKQLIELSKNRVNSVRFYLLQKGIKVNRIKTIGYGPSKPIYTGSDPERQKENRRVDFKIIKT